MVQGSLRYIARCKAEVSSASCCCRQLLELLLPQTKLKQWNTAAACTIAPHLWTSSAPTPLCASTKHSPSLRSMLLLIPCNAGHDSSHTTILLSSSRVKSVGSSSAAADFNSFRLKVNSIGWAVRATVAIMLAADFVCTHGLCRAPSPWRVELLSCANSTIAEMAICSR